MSYLKGAKCSSQDELCAELFGSPFTPLNPSSARTLRSLLLDSLKPSHHPGCHFRNISPGIQHGISFLSKVVFLRKLANTHK